MKSIFAVLLYLCCVQAHSQSLEGEQLAAFDQLCPGDNMRAVFAEPLPGELEGWINLVCLDESLQETIQWFLSPDGQLFESIEDQIPAFVRPFAEPYLSDRIGAMSEDEIIALWLDFEHVEPELPSLEFFGALPGAALSSSTATTSTAPVLSTFFIDGEEVSQAEFEIWNQAFVSAVQAQSAERDRLVRAQALVSLQLLADINNWHDWLNINTINEDQSTLPFWATASSLVIELNGTQANELLNTGESLVFLSEYTEAATDDGEQSAAAVTSTIETSITTDNIIVDGNEISWPDDGWYQVQLLGDDGNASLCEGGLSCEVPPGEYIVINHTTGQRFSGILVSGTAATPIEASNPFSIAITPPTNLRLLVYSDTTAELLWERDANTLGLESTTIIRNGVEHGSTDGTSYLDDSRIPGVLYFYDLIARGTAGEVSETVSISDEGLDQSAPVIATERVVVDGNTIVLSGGDYYQVQDALTFESICEGVSLCHVTPGMYIVVNHTSGERIEGVSVTSIAAEVDSAAIVVLGNTISWPDNGWYQVQNADTFENVCEGGRSCSVAAGNYVVINHTSAERFEDIRVMPIQTNSTNIGFLELVSGDLAFTQDLTFNQPRFQVISNQEQLNTLYFEALTDSSCEGCNFPSPPLVDFNNNTVVLVAHEIVPSGGYSIAIDNVALDNDQVSIDLVKTAPGDGCAVTAAFTGPYKLYQLNGLFSRIDFIERSVQGAVCE